MNHSSLPQSAQCANKGNMCHNLIHNKSSLVNILVNSYTKNFANSEIPSDVIQSSLEYNQFLINQLNEISHTITKEEYQCIMNNLWENLNKLSCHLDKQLTQSNLSKSKRYCKNYKKKPNKKHKPNKHKETIQVIHTSNKGVIITIDKSILT